MRRPRPSCSEIGHKKAKVPSERGTLAFQLKEGWDLGPLSGCTQMARYPKSALRGATQSTWHT